jgi:hypothetical protein
MNLILWYMYMWGIRLDTEVALLNYSSSNHNPEAQK